jgi:hypothetical protein
LPFSAGLLVRFAPLGRPRSRQWSQVGHDGGLLRPSTIQVAILSALSALGCCQSCLLDADALLPLNAGLAGWQPGMPAAAEWSGPIGAQDWQAGLDPLKHVVSPKPARGTIISLNPAVSAEPKAGWCSWLGEMLPELIIHHHQAAEAAFLSSDTPYEVAPCSCSTRSTRRWRRGPKSSRVDAAHGRRSSCPAGPPTRVTPWATHICFCSL